MEDAARLTPVPGGVVQLVRGSIFAVSDTAGDIIPFGPLGLFHRDEQRWEFCPIDRWRTGC